MTPNPYGGDGDRVGMNTNTSNPADITTSIIDSLLDDIHLLEIMEEYGLTDEDILSDIGPTEEE